MFYRRIFALFSCIFVILFTLQFLPVIDGMQFDVAQCGHSKRCEFGGCAPGKAQNAASCAYLFSMEPEGPDSVQMEIYTRRNAPDVKYVAVAFSDDTQMGDDAVTYCVLTGNGRVEARLSVNPANTKNNVPAPAGAENGFLELLEGKADDNGIYCKFRQHSNNGPGKNLARPNLHKPYYLFLAKGPAEEAHTIGIHSLDSDDHAAFPHISARPIVPLDASSLNKQPKQPQQQQQQPPQNHGHGGGLTLIDVHGIMMVIAWLCLTSVALYSARFMRSAWPHTTIMGLKIWFHIHRTLNFLSVIVMVVSVLLVVLFKGRWTGPWFGDIQIGWGAWHSLAGAASVFLALTQPFGALFRCGIDHPKRPLFNWAHRGVGLTAFVLALFSIFVALWKFKSHFALANFALWLLIIFYIVAFLIILASEVLRSAEMKEHRRLDGIEMQTRVRGTTPSDAYYYHNKKNFSSKLSSIRKVLFIVSTLLCVGVSLLLVLLILLH
ncbi:hypothetical protein niasHT_001202 [Heterodera trifolii]|uniref:Ferric-chelate reductase 1 n=1 Tax=Heterodera trifolii TaxID=157864 RepID=A0ABD2MEJ1_9BILA